MTPQPANADLADAFDIEPDRLLRLWPVIDVYGRLNRLVGAKGCISGDRRTQSEPAA